ncbi:MAG: hypothetical protein HY658_07810, partial [Actinobacteria bacterium]|nr:hypothetical protein [Actinomycetota bacterium]
MNAHRRDRIRWLPAAGLAWGGVVLGHLVAYLLASPDPAARAAHLSATGHGGFHTLVMAVAGALPVALALVAARAVRPGGEPPSRGATAIVLLSLQVPGFALVESVERGSVALALADPVVLGGLAVQVVLALLGAVASTAFERAVGEVARALRSVPPRRAPSPAPTLPLHRD